MQKTGQLACHDGIVQQGGATKAPKVCDMSKESKYQQQEAQKVVEPMCQNQKGKQRVNCIISLIIFSNVQ